jgi:nucleotide-binding universal stress UspA family protein
VLIGLRDRAWRAACSSIQRSLTRLPHDHSTIAETIALEAYTVIIQSVLCAVDFSPESPDVLRAAMTVAARERAPLTVLHVLDPLLVQAAHIEYEQGMLQASADKDLQALIARVATSAGVVGGAGGVGGVGVGGVGAGVDPAAVRRRLRVGAPAREILAEGADNPATLLVIGTHGFSGVRRVLFGSTAARVISRATTPVLALPPRARLDVHRLLVAVDFTTECMHAIKEAASLASRWNLTMTLLHAVPEIPGFEQWKTFIDLDQDKRIERARRELEMLAREIASERLAVREIAVGGAVEEVINRIAAEEPGTLVVMGLRAPSLLPPRSGTTAYRLLSTSSSPVLIVPSSARSGPGI